MAVWNNAASAAQPAHLKCFKIGATITVIGNVVGNVNGGTYLQLLKPICVDYPKPPDSREAHNLTPVGEILPPNKFLKITGVLHDSFERHMVGFDIHVKDTVDVDEEVKTSLADAKQRCEKWQDDNSENLTKKAHGGRVAPIF